MKFIKLRDDPEFLTKVAFALRTSMKMMAAGNEDDVWRVGMAVGEGTTPDVGWGVMIDASPEDLPRNFLASERSGITVFGFKDKAAADQWMEKLREEMTISDDQAQFTSWEMEPDGKTA